MDLDANRDLIATKALSPGEFFVHSQSGCSASLTS